MRVTIEFERARIQFSVVFYMYIYMSTTRRKTSFARAQYLRICFSSPSRAQALFFRVSLTKEIPIDSRFV